MFKKNLIASFLIVILVLLPFHTSFTLASINTARVEGKNGVRNVVRTQDDINVEAEFNEQVSKDNVKFKLGEEYTPDECTSTCTLALENKTTQPGPHKVSVFQYNNGAIVDDISGNYYAESSGPVIEELSLQEEGNYTLDTSIKDLTCSGCDKCAGVGSIEITKDYEVIKTLEVNSTSCNTDSEFTLTKKELGLKEGENDICFIPVDRIGNKGEKLCLQETIDTTKPKLDSFRLKGKAGDEIKYISKNENIEATAIVNFTEKNLTNAIADFSDFNTILGEKYEGMEGDCEKISKEKHQCKWDVKIRGEEGSLPYTIKATDIKGNTAKTEDSIKLTVDNSPPVVEGVYNNREVPTQKIYMHEGQNRIWAEFAGQGAGYLKEQAYLDFMFGSVINRDKRADGCTFEDGSWFCYWNLGIPSSTSASTGRIAITSKTKDDAGNSLKKEVSKEVQLDNERPEILKQDMKTPCPYSGQEMVIDFRIKDKTPVSVTTTPKLISGDNSTRKAECEPSSENTHSCTLKIDNLVSEYETERLNIEITDAASNKKITSENAEVCKKVSGKVPFNVKMDYSVSGRLDRRMLSYVALPVVADIQLKPEDGIHLLDKKASCGPFIKNSRLLDEQTNNPQLVTRVKKNAANKDANSSEISLSCTLDLSARKGKKVYSQPVSKHLNLTVPNNKVGDIDDTVQEKIDSVQDDIDDIKNDIEEYEQWNKWLSMICSMGETIAKLNAVMGIVKSVVYMIAGGLTSVCGTQYGKAACEAGWSLWTTVCGYTSKYDIYATKYVWYPPFMQGFGNTGQYVKILCMVYSCKLCTLDYAKTYADLTGIDSKIVRVAGSFTAGWYSGIPGAVQGTSWASAGVGAASGASAAWSSEQSKGSHISLVLDGNTMDPYKSIHAARACLCIPGILYNLRKEKQINCMYKNCLQENAEKGLPTSVCDKAFRMRHCLYVEGAQWKLLGSSQFFSFFENLIGTIIRNSPLIMAAESWGTSCTSKIRSKCYNSGPGTGRRLFTDMQAKANLGCHVSGAALQVAQVGGFSISEGFDKYSGTLEGDTVC